MTDFVIQSPRTDGPPPVDAADWNEAIVYNSLALYERLPHSYPYIQVGNTVVETELFRQTIPANALATKGYLIGEMSGILQNNSGSTANPIIRYYLGATAIYGFSPAVPTGANRVFFRYTVRIQNLAANSQLSVIDFIRNATAVPEGTLATMTAEGGWSLDAIDTTAELDFIATFAWGTAHATRIFDMVGAHVFGPIALD